MIHHLVMMAVSDLRARSLDILLETSAMRTRHVFASDKGRPGIGKKICQQTED